MPSRRNLLFIPALHNLATPPPPATPTRAFCPSPRHALVVPPSPFLPPRSVAAKGARRARHPPAAVAAPSRNSAAAAAAAGLTAAAAAAAAAATTATVAAVAVAAPPSPSARRARSGRPPAAQAADAEPVASSPPPVADSPVSEEAPVREEGDSVRKARARGGAVSHRHTPESRRKISEANRGNVPWNKGRRHSEATKRKIAESTRRAMLRPEMRRLLQERALGRRHSEATKLKIRQTARLTRATRSAVRKAKRVPVPFAFSSDAIADLNGRVQRQLETKFQKDPSAPQRLITRGKRSMPQATRDKLSMRIKEMWNDPEYRSKVEEGVERRARRLESEHSSPSQSVSESAGETTESSGDRLRESSRSPRRRSRTRRLSVHEILEQEDEKPLMAVENKSSEFFLPSDSLKGFTKEDLGIFDVRGVGPIVDADSLASGDLEAREVDNQAGAQLDVLREHEVLVSSLAHPRPAPFSDEEFENMAGSTDDFDFSALNGSSSEMLGSSGLTGSHRGSTKENDELALLPDSDHGTGNPFFEGPVDLMSSSFVDFASPFVSVSSFGKLGDPELQGQTNGADSMSNKAPMNFSADDFGNLDPFENGTTSF